MGTHPGSSDRIQKVLANQGLGSRREIEKYIEQGLIRVNGQVAKLGDRIVLEDKLQFRGRKINLKKDPYLPDVLLYHKPIDQICSKSDPEGRDSVFNHLPKCPHGRWVIVGRLDINTSGLLLFTSSGELANKLMHPRFEIEREYSVRVFGELSAKQMKYMVEKGVELDDGVATIKSIRFAGGESQNHWYKIVLSEGKNREIRRIFEALGYQVSRLIRIRYGKVSMPSYLRRGKSELLAVKAVKQLIQFSNDKPL